MPVLLQQDVWTLRPFFLRPRTQWKVFWGGVGGAILCRITNCDRESFDIIDNFDG